ncbi:MAG: 3-phosphoshikimate 1-carboxyvinyltransferase [Clostridia bacterium]|nr:3-phosphoshikimate 1-carboxyvinyltransferase [Clostridia bacterium]
MTVKLMPGSRSGIAKAPPSKSYAHRLLIAAALSDRGCVVENAGTSDDIEATAACLSGLGAGITKVSENSLKVTPVKSIGGSAAAILPVRESGSTLRFLLPVAGALGVKAEFKMEGRLPERPMADFIAALEKGGMKIEKEGATLRCGGRLSAGVYEIPGNVSSQFISGLLFALPLAGGNSRIVINGKTESKAYIDMTFEVLKLFKAGITKTEDGFAVEGGKRLEAPEGALVTEGDWSGAAFLLAAGAFSKKGVTVSGLNLKTEQGDSGIVDILGKFGATVKKGNGSITVSKGNLKGITIDASEIPDLVPVLAITACGAEGRTEITNAKRLRFKETDRLKTTAELIRSLGGTADETEDGLVIEGGKLIGGVCESFSDHRIAMAASLAACITEGAVTVNGAECVRKSFPDFFEVFGQLEIEDGGEK